MRIQILQLPPVMVGDDLAEPFALVVDQCRYDDPNLMSPFVAEAAQGQWKRFAEECGARTVLVTDETVEIVDQYAGPAASLPKLVVPIRVSEDFDPETAKRELRFALGRCVECGKRIHGCICDKPPVPPAVRDLSDSIHEAFALLKQTVKDYGLPCDLIAELDQENTAAYRAAGLKAREALGIFGHISAATGVPHAFDDRSESAPSCIVCGLGRLAEVHVTARWPKIQRDRSEDDL